MTKPAKNLEADATPSTALTPIERAKVAINSAEHEKKLAELAKASVSITAITNTAGYEQCHSARMALKKVRIDIERIGKGAREDAQSFSKAVIAEEKRLIQIIEPEETRLERIQREWDDARRREKEAKEEAERQRIAAIQARIDEIRQRPADAAGQSVAEIELYVKALVGLEIDDTFAELKQQAEGAKATSLIRLRATLAKAQAMEAEQARLAAERAENERIRQENEARSAALEAQQAAESQRIAEEDRKAREARQAEEQRLAAIRGRIQTIRAYPDGASLKSAASVQAMLDSAKAMVIDETFAELREEAQTVLDEVVRTLANVHYERKTHEEEQARLAAERVRLAAQEQERKEAREAEDRRIAAERAEVERIEAERQAVREADERRLAEQRAQLEREQQEFRLAQERAAAPPPVDIPAPESAPVAQATEEPADPLLMTIRLTEWLPMQEVCKAAKEWAVFQGPDSKADQKTDRKLAARAREAVNNLLIAVEQLL